MLNKKYLLFFWVILPLAFLQAQLDLGTTLSFIPVFQQEKLCLDTEQAPKSKSDISIEKLQLYITQIGLYAGDHLVYAEENSFHLLDITKPMSLNVLLNTPPNLTFSTLQFNLGVDSLTNVSGAQGGALDPSLGMYWTWQSGYINLKLEGTATNCPARNQRFQFHVGGYQTPGNTLQQLRLAVPMSKNLEIQISLDDFLASIDLSEEYQVMSPNAAAIELAQRFAATFKVIE